jgi:hypothetical protein
MKTFLYLFLLFFTHLASAQIAVINEFASDATNFDGQGGEFIELYCPIGGGACDISCWAISDGQGVITIPSGTTIAAGGFYLIAYSPSFNCDTCDFAGLTVDLNMATCNCLTGGAYSAAPNGQSILTLGQGANAGEMVYLYNQNGVEVETWKFDNAAGTAMPMGGNILSAVSNGCPAKNIDVTDPNNPQVVNVGQRCVGCNTSYTRAADGGFVWTTDDHPTPRASNTLRGFVSFSYQYNIDGGGWQTFIPNSTSSNTQTAALSLCAGNTIMFRVAVRNFQNVLTTQYNNAGQIGSYFQSTQTGRIDWPTFQGLGTADGEFFYLISNSLTLPNGNSSYTLQWADFNRALGSNLANSSNECYERLNININKKNQLVSAQVACSDPFAGLNAVTTFPANLSGISYQLYDDAGSRSNLVQSNTSGIFQLVSSAVPTVGYYVVVTGLCNEILATAAPLAFCRAEQPCPLFNIDTLKINSSICTSPCNACPNDILNLFANGNNLPGGGSIEWYSNEIPNFNPYAGQGNFIGQVAIPTLPICTAPTPRLNEVLYRPAANNGSVPDGSWIELIVPAGTNIGCFVLTDGDWTITIPPNTTVPPDGIFSIGNGAVPAYAGISFDLNVATCNCARDSTFGAGANLLNLTDGGEYVAFFNNSGSFLNGLSWGNPIGTNAPGQGSRTIANVIQTRAVAGCPVSLTIPSVGYNVVAGGVAIDASLAAIPDGSNSWTAQAGGSLNRCNDAPPPVAMPSLNYTLPISDCNKTIFIKGIVRPHPNTAVCLNTASTSFTREYQINISCPTATLTTSSTAVCGNALPVSLNINTTGLPNGSPISVFFTRNGSNQITTSSISSNSATITVTQTGSYQLNAITTAGFCPTAGSGIASVQVIPLPPTPNVPNNIAACENTQAVISASGAVGYEWSYFSNFSVIAATSLDFSATVPSTVFVRAFNDNPAAPPAVSCTGTPKSITITSKVCPDITYPLTWLDFNAQRVENDILLSWATGSELNTSHFEVQHSADGVRFAKISSQLAAGQSSSRIDYSFLHTQPFSGWNYYQIKQIDIDNSFTFSRKAAVYYEDERAYFVVFPNPIENENLQIRFFDKVLRNSQIFIYNNLGQLVYQNSLNSNERIFNIPLQNLAAGV